YINFLLEVVLLRLRLSWISVSVSDSQTLEVQSGEEVTLLCSNFSSSTTEIFWFRVTKRSELHCICSTSQPDEPVSFCKGLQSGKFEMSTNISTVFLKIKQVDLLDSGLYFCGAYLSNYAVIVHATNVEVQDVFDRVPKIMSVVLGALTVFLIMAVIYLAAKIKHLQKGIFDSTDFHIYCCYITEPFFFISDPDYAAVTFHPKTESHHRLASVRENQKTSGTEVLLLVF
uniref:Ig-like domain-containing protein n=1 Tax=Neolamprologus brichardi TaxID=32507 RepID=A0A3Q4H7L4_NEOBR